MPKKSNYAVEITIQTKLVRYFSVPSHLTTITEVEEEVKRQLQREFNKGKYGPTDGQTALGISFDVEGLKNDTDL